MAGLRNIGSIIIPRFNPSVLQTSSNRVHDSWLSKTMVRAFASGSSDQPYSSNDEIAPRIRNRNPMNLEMMRIGRKPQGFQMDYNSRSYWNRLTLEITNRHTTAQVTHWSGRPVASASTMEAAVRKQLYNLTDLAAIQAVAKIIAQRCLETGVSEVYLDVNKTEKEKDKMQKFIQIIEDSGLSLSEPEEYKHYNPHKDNLYEMKPQQVKPWTVPDE